MKKLRILIYAIKYYLQGDDWSDAVVFAKIICNFKRAN